MGVIDRADIVFGIQRCELRGASSEIVQLASERLILSILKPAPAIIANTETSQRLQHRVRVGAAGIDNVRFTPETIQHAISKAKNLLQTPEAYAKNATDFMQRLPPGVFLGVVLIVIIYGWVKSRLPS